MLTKIHLKGKYYSQRGVKLRQLNPEDSEGNLLNAAKLAGKEAGLFEIKKLEYREGIKLFIAEITEPVAELADDVKWKKVDYQYVENNFSDLFTPKDYQVLERMYREFHDCSQDEVDAIAGKAVVVSED